MAYVSASAAESKVPPGPRSHRKNKQSSVSDAPTDTIERADSPQPMVSGDDALVDQTKHQIRQLVNEIADLAKSECSVEAFYQGFLTRTTGALASEGGAIWMRAGSDQPLKIQYHINLKQTILANDTRAQKTHSGLVQRVADAGEPELVAPLAESANASQGGNPTENLLIFGPLKVNNQTVGLVEILQRPGAGPTTQRGYLRFLMQMCDLASEFLTNERIRAFDAQQAMWGTFEQFIQRVHGDLNLDQTIYAVANEGRRVIGCDRVSVVLKKGRRCTVKAVSGLDSIERRSDQLKRLSDLSRIVIKGRSELWYDGEETEIAPQIETKLHAYVDRSHCKMMAIIPLFHRSRTGDLMDDEDTGAPQRISSATPKQTPIGALIVERLNDSESTEDFRKRVAAVSSHSEIAITNSLEHHSIFLMPLWKALGKMTSAFSGGRLFRTLATLSVVGFAIAFLCLFPWDFSLSATGSLMPQQKHEIYAQSAGVVEELFVSDDGDSVVQQGQLLAVLTNNDLAVAIENLRSSIQEADARLAISSGLRSRDSLDQYERETLEIDIEQARQEKKGLSRELNLRLMERENLQVRSPIAGVVTNWQAHQKLIHRPVERGQNLMTIINPDSGWLLELELPERRLGHLIEQMSTSDEPPRVTFTLASFAGQQFEGRVQMVDRQLDVHSDEGNTCLVRVAFDNDDLAKELRRMGTRVQGKIHCGQRSIGYVIFHEAIETVQAKWLLWF